MKKTAISDEWLKDKVKDGLSAIPNRDKASRLQVFGSKVVKLNNKSIDKLDDLAKVNGALRRVGQRNRVLQYANKIRNAAYTIIQSIE